jgi:hypothetical protein
MLQYAGCNKVVWTLQLRRLGSYLDPVDTAIPASVESAAESKHRRRRIDSVHVIKVRRELESYLARTKAEIERSATPRRCIQ